MKTYTYTIKIKVRKSVAERTMQLVNTILETSKLFPAFGDYKIAPVAVIKDIIMFEILVKSSSEWWSKALADIINDSIPTILKAEGLIPNDVDKHVEEHIKQCNIDSVKILEQKITKLMDEENIRKHDDKTTITFQEQEIDRLQNVIRNKHIKEDNRFTKLSNQVVSKSQTIHSIINILGITKNIDNYTRIIRNAHYDKMVECTIINEINKLKQANTELIMGKQANTELIMGKLADKLKCKANLESIMESINKLHNKIGQEFIDETDRLLTPEPIKPDMVNHPPHYGKGHRGKECIEIAELLPYNLGCVIKYIWRYQDKENPLQDLEKALWYLKRHMTDENLNNSKKFINCLTSEERGRLDIVKDGKIGDVIISQLLHAFKNQKNVINNSLSQYAQARGYLIGLIENERIKTRSEG